MESSSRCCRESGTRRSERRYGSRPGNGSRDMARCLSLDRRFEATLPTTNPRELEKTRSLYRSPKPLECPSDQKTEQRPPLQFPALRLANEK